MFRTSAWTAGAASRNSVTANLPPEARYHICGVVSEAGMGILDFVRKAALLFPTKTATIDMAVKIVCSRYDNEETNNSPGRR